jgi:putative ABC transport system permease protein
VYGVTAFAVSRRTRELGIRVALGAHPRALMAMVLRESLGLAAGGLVAGAALGIAAGRYLATIFYQVRVADPAVFAAVAAVVLAVAIGATYVPARRAMRVDPVVALRSE